MAEDEPVGGGAEDAGEDEEGGFGGEGEVGLEEGGDGAGHRFVCWGVLVGWCGRFGLACEEATWSSALVLMCGGVV